MDLANVRFGVGAHNPARNPTGDRDMCVMEAVAFMAGEPWSDRPMCACPVVSAFLRSWNDELSDDDRDRLLPADVWVPKLINSRQRFDRDAEIRRARLVFDWLVRSYIPAWFDLVPALAEHAATLRGLPEMAGGPGEGLHPSVSYVFRSASRDAWEAHRVAASKNTPRVPLSGMNAWKITGGQAAIRAASEGITMYWDVVRGAPKDAAYAASASGVDLSPTIAALQQSALDLLDRTLACGADDSKEG